jgi:hypothetical protein
MADDWLTGLAALILLTGCATSRIGTGAALTPPREDQVSVFARAQQTLEHSFPPAYRATHRAVITMGRRQYVCDGFLTADPTNGVHLALVSTLGLVGEVRLGRDGAAEVVKVTPLFREDWSREYVLRDLRWLFAPAGEVHAVGALAGGQLMLASRETRDGVQAFYRFSADGRRWEELELRAPGRPVYRAVLTRSRQYEGWPRELPYEIRVEAGTYQLHLRVAELTIRSAAGAHPEVSR